MKRFFRPRAFGVCYGALLTVAAGLALLDTFVIPRAERAATDAPFVMAAASDQGAKAGATGATESAAQTTGETAEPPAQAAGAATLSADGNQPAASPPEVTATSYKDSEINISIETLRESGTTYYVADIRLSDPSYLRTALAQSTYGRNIRETTTDMATEAHAILAVNGDYYSFRNSGYVVRNGTLYRASESDNDLLLIDRQGDFTVMTHDGVSPTELASGKWWQAFSFGPGLVSDGKILVRQNQEVGQAKNSNPRTAVGQIGPLHYVFVVSDGRTDESEGLTLYQLAEVMRGLGCQTAYNMDGGGSSTMVFMGAVVNRPTSNGSSIAEREVSDIVYIGL